MRKLKLLAGAALLAASAASAAHADQVINDDLIVTFSACIGSDCVNGENFGFDTLRLKENNLRIHFNDTSSSASFPTSDWRIVANDSSNGGANYLAFEDSDAGTRPFQVDAGAGNNALRVESGGNVGFGTSNPAVNLHVVEGNTPTLRLEQDGSSGFTPQVYDVAANEANFFIRDVTNGSALFFRAQPGAPENSLYIANDGDIGMGTASPAAALHVREVGGTNLVPSLLVEDAAGTTNIRELLRLKNNGGAFLTFENTSTGRLWYAINENSAPNRFLIRSNAGGDPEFALDSNGNLIIQGEITTSGTTCGTGCDLVFEEGFPLRSIEEHNALMWENGYLPNVGPTVEGAPINVSDKVGRMLNELEHAHIYIGQLNTRISELEASMAQTDG